MALSPLMAAKGKVMLERNRRTLMVKGSRAQVASVQGAEQEKGVELSSSSCEVSYLSQGLQADLVREGVTFLFLPQFLLQKLRSIEVFYFYFLTVAKYT